MNAHFFKEPIAKAGQILFDKGPTILTVLGVIGTVGTAVEASKATLKAKDVWDQCELGTKEKIMKVAPLYIPSVILGSATIGCIVGSNYVNVKKNVAMAGLYSAANEAVRKLEKKESERSALIEPPKSKKDIVNAKGGDTLCFDCLSGRYFMSDMETIRKIENDINYQINFERAVCVNDFYFGLGIDGNKFGESNGWSCEEPLIIEYNAKLCSDGTPCLVIDFKYSPKPIFMAGCPW